MDGNVGIGTTSPDSKLSVVGSGGADDTKFPELRVASSGDGDAILY